MNANDTAYGTLLHDTLEQTAAHCALALEALSCITAGGADDGAVEQGTALLLMTVTNALRAHPKVPPAAPPSPPRTQHPA